MFLSAVTPMMCACQETNCLHACMIEKDRYFTLAHVSTALLCFERPSYLELQPVVDRLLWLVFMSAYCMFDLSVYYLLLLYFDTVGWVF